MTADMQDQLLPCPFCGGRASPGGRITYSEKHEAWWPDGARVREAFFVNCLTCSVDNKGFIGHQTREAAIAAWNRRASLSGSVVDGAPQQDLPPSRDWVLVPREPTEEMMRAGCWELSPGTGRAVYAAMLSAAPPPPLEWREKVARIVREAIEAASDSAIPEPWEVSAFHAERAADAILALFPAPSLGGGGDCSSRDHAQTTCAPPCCQPQSPASAAGAESPACRVCGKSESVGCHWPDRPEQTICVDCCPAAEHDDGETGHVWEYDRAEQDRVCQHCGQFARNTDYYDHWDGP